jgi:hypothetical protein
MTPDADHFQSCLAEPPIYHAIAMHVAGDFPFPIFAVGLWHSAMPTAAMPKATTNKNGQPGLRKNKIRFAE